MKAHTWPMIRLALVSGLLAIGVSFANRAAGLPGLARAALALIPVIPLVAFFFRVVDWLDSLDELQRRIHLEAMLLQFGATGILVMGYGMLARVDAVPNFPVTTLYPWLWMAMFLFWAGGIAFVRRKYE
ncbi:MAG: hypothetical protein ACKVZ0_01960 [Gemmatimonadales bacterium]